MNATLHFERTLIDARQRELRRLAATPVALRRRRRRPVEPCGVPRDVPDQRR